MANNSKAPFLTFIDMKNESTTINPVPEYFCRTLNKESRINRALSIRADAVTGFYTTYDLSAKYNLRPNTISKILTGVKCNIASLQDGLGCIRITRNSVKTLSSVVKILHLVGLSYNKIAIYLGASRQYTAALGHKNDSKRRPLVPVILTEGIKTKTSKKIAAGNYFIQYADTAEWILLYEAPEQMPHFVSTEEIKGRVAIAMGLGVILPNLQ